MDHGESDDSCQGVLNIDSKPSIYTKTILKNDLFMLKRTIHRTLAKAGLQVQRYRDPYVEMSRILGRDTIKTALDGGAYHGGATQRLLDVFPTAVVHAFEPQAKCFGIVTTKFTGNIRVVVHPKALSDSCGEVTFHVNEQDYTSSILQTTQPDQMRPASTTTVETVTIDSLRESHGFVPQVIKLDLQGFELAALKGAAKALENDVKALLIEVNFQRRYEGCCLEHEVASFLADYGFYLHRLYDLITDPDGRYRLADGLFIRD
jgi:FkbM family methyltransferase